MDTPEFVKQVTAAARQIARIELRLRKARAQLAELDAHHRDAKQHLRLLVRATEPYTPPTPDEVARALDAADEA